MIPRALGDAIDDPIVQGLPLEIYVRCHLWLEPHRHRPLPRAIVARAVRAKDQNVGRAIQLLCDNGYLERGANLEHGVPTYRILLTRYVRSAA